MNPVLSIGLYLILQVITVLQLEKWLEAGKWGHKTRKGVRRVLRPLYFLLALLPVGGALLPDSRVKFAIQAAGNIWLGFYIYLFMFMVVSVVILLALSLATRRRSARRSHAALILCVCAAAAVWAAGLIHARDIHVNHYEVQIEKEAGGLEELKAVLIADLHMSVNSYPSMIREMVDLINAEEPDVVLIAGDIFTSSYEGMRNPELYADILKGIRAGEGVYAVYGNHDVEETLFGGFPISPISKAFRTEKMEQFFRDAGFTVLYDESVLIAGDRVEIVGRVDGEKAGDGTALRMSPAEVLSETDRTKPVIVLQHEPVEFAELKENGADLALCGHTHNGQVFPGNLIVPFFNENAYGYKNIGGLDTIVTSGIGYYGPPMRVGTDSEIAVIHIRFGA